MKGVIFMKEIIKLFGKSVGYIIFIGLTTYGLKGLIDDLEKLFQD